jgi:hypothetical protein
MNGTMNRAEKFALVVAVVGLIANLLSVVASAVVIAQAGSPTTQINQNTQHLTSMNIWQALAAVTLAYSWFVISWFLTRRYFLVWVADYLPSLEVCATSLDRDFVERRELTRFGQRAFLIAFGVGAVLVPLAALIDPALALSALFVIPLLWGVEAILMPVIYPKEMDIDRLFTEFLYSF